LLFENSYESFDCVLTLRYTAGALLESSMSSANIFISGGASGLGKAFVQQYAAQIHDSPGARWPVECIIYVLDRQRKPSSVGQLAQMLELPYDSDWLDKHLVYIDADVTDAASLPHSLAEVSVLALVIHSAGVRGLVSSVPLKQYSDVAKAETMDVMDAETMRSTFEINSMGTFFLLRALLPALRQYARCTLGLPPAVVVMGSRMGSVGHNTELGKAYAYRASKAALNAIVKSFSVDVPEVIWTVMHPGRVDTGLVSIKEDEAMPVQQVVKELLPLVSRLERKDSGRFVDRFGMDIPW